MPQKVLSFQISNKNEIYFRYSETVVFLKKIQFLKGAPFSFFGTFSYQKNPFRHFGLFSTVRATFEKISVLEGFPFWFFEKGPFKFFW